ncbi:MAG: S8 family serine peptidase [Lachnospiraceae bacterium]|nr:S8 family serine peptidase [Lachnospiraceae bacterium]
MKKICKRVLIGLLILVLAFGAFLALWVFFLFPNFFDPNRGQVEETPFVAEESEYIDFNQENGILYINNEVVIFAKASATWEQMTQLAEEYGGELDETMGDIGVYRLMLPDAMTYEDLERLVKKIKTRDTVEDAYLNLVSEFEADDVDEAAEGDIVYKEAAYPSDPWNGDEWNMEVPRGENWGMEAIHAPNAWGYRDDMTTVKVGLIDTMPDISHEDLSIVNSTSLFINPKNGAVAEGTYVVPADEHGTHVSGTISARWGNDTGVSGVMGGMGELYHSQTYYDKGKNYDSGYGTAYSYLLDLKTLLDQDVQVINISQNTNRLIGFAASHGNQNAIQYLTTQAKMTEAGLARIISARQQEGRPDFLICVAAGNSNSTYYYRDNSYPYGYRTEMKWGETIMSLFGWKGEVGGSLALYNNFLNLMTASEVKDRVVVVGAAGIDGSRSTNTETFYYYAGFSNVGARVDIVAPGCDVYSCQVDGYKYNSGTSMATPHVTGVAGLIFACNPELTGPEAKEILLASTTTRFYYEDGTSRMVDAGQAVENALRSRNMTLGRVLQTSVNEGMDLCFVVDTTGSMQDDIDNAKANMVNILESLREKTENYRVALIDYRDFPDRSGASQDYPCKVQLAFSDDDAEITNAVNGLELGDGGDNEETVFSALMEAVKLDWRLHAKKIIIILGDAAPLNPEPVTGYTYEDVLLALFNADISLDYEKSDKRVADSMGESLINVFSIGTDASSDAEDFFASIAEETGGSYAGVSDASKVSDAIMDSIEQIEVKESFRVNVKFGEDMANDSIDFYDEDGYLFTAETDEEGRVNLDDMEAGDYRWSSRGVYAAGSIEIGEKESSVSAKASREYWFTPVQKYWRQNRTGLLLASLGILAACVLAPVILAGLRRKILSRKSPQSF